MTSRQQTDLTGDAPAELEDESPQNLPAMAWVTLVGFAVFVVAFGTCASTFLFD